MSYFGGGKLKASGHKSPRMLGTYDRAIEQVEASFFSEAADRVFGKSEKSDPDRA